MASVDSMLLPSAPKQPEISIDFWPCWSLSSWGMAPVMFSFPTRVPYLLPQRRFAVYKNKRNVVTAKQQMLLQLRFSVRNTAGMCNRQPCPGTPFFCVRHQSPAEAQIDGCVLAICQVGNGKQRTESWSKKPKESAEIKTKLKVYERFWCGVETDVDCVTKQKRNVLKVQLQTT